MTLTQALIIVGAGLIAGAMNAVAGGGTVLTFPALLAVGMPAIHANATSTLALMAGMIGSVYGYRAHLPTVKPWLGRFGLVSVLGGLLGALLLTVTDEKVFSRLVPWLLLFATVLFMTQPLFRKLVAIESSGPRHVFLAIAVQFVTATYNGYFGAGIGILMLAVFGLLGMHHIHEMNALKTVLAASVNLTATIYFIFAGLIHWPEAILMTVGATGGYFAGSHYAQRISPAQVRVLITVIGLGISAWLFWKQIHG